MTQALFWRIATVIGVVCAGIGKTQMVLDRLIVGNATSEQEHGVVAQNAPLVSYVGNTARYVEKGGIYNFTMVCGEYVSVEFSGDDNDNATELIAIFPAYFGGIVSADSYPPEINLCLSDRVAHVCMGGVATGRSQLVTYAIPKEICEASPLSITSFSAARSQIFSQIFTHNESTVDFPGVRVGATPAPAPPRKDWKGRTQEQYLEDEVVGGVCLMAEIQAFGEEWDACVANGSMPAVMTGAVFRGGWQGYVNRGLNVSELENSWGRGSAGSNNNWFRGLEVLARAGGSENMQRVLAGVDFLCRAQGANGGFDGVGRGYGWVGGPMRENASGVLEGYGHMGFAGALNLITLTSDMLAEKIDNDANPSTPNVTRFQAYEQLLSKSRDYLLTNGGHAPNQEIADVLAAVLGNRALQRINSSLAQPIATLLPHIREAVGLTNSYIYPQTPWISELGISMEPNGRLNGGYTAGYGDLGWMVMWLAEILHGEEGVGDVVDRAENITNALRFLRFPDNCRDVGAGFGAVEYRCLRMESVVSARHNKNPGRVSYGGGADNFAALVLKNQYSQRLVQLQWEHGALYSIHLSDASLVDDPHWPDDIADSSKLLATLNETKGLTTTTRLPWEEGQPDFVFGDAEAGLAVIRDGTTRLFAALQWRHGFNTSDPSRRIIANVVLNNIARIHLTTPTLDRVLVANMSLTSPHHGFQEIWSVYVDEYIIAMHNGLESEATSLPFVLDDAVVGKPAIDLTTQTPISNLPPSFTLNPQQTLFLKLKT